MVLLAQFFQPSPPSPIEDAEHFRFRFYFSAIQGAAKQVQGLGNFADMAGHIVSGQSFRRLQNPRADLRRAEVMMRNAWFTEEQLFQPFKSGNDDLISYANHWAPVQLYYCVHLAWRTFIAASGEVVDESHRRTLSHVAAKIKSKPDLFLPPWASTMLGDPRDDKVLTLNPTDCCSEVFQALKSTRNKRLEELVAESKQNNRKPSGEKYYRIPVHLKSQALKTLEDTPTSFFDFLYRLRIVSNYETADLFLVAMGSPVKAKTFNETLRVLASSVLLNLELLIAQRIGKANYKEWVRRFNQVVPSSTSAALLRDRCEAIVRAF